MAAFAAGARRSKRRFVALEPFTLLRVRWVPGRGELLRLREVTAERQLRGILRDLERMRAAGAGLELVREATIERAADPALFATALRFLGAMDAGGPARETLAVFGLRLLVLAGLGARLDACTVCGRPVPEHKAAMFDDLRGGLVCRACGGGPLTIPGALLDRLRNLIAAGSFPEAPWPGEQASVALGLVLRLSEAQIGKPLEGLASLAGGPERGPPRAIRAPRP